jgi:hypothetical protein
MAVRGSRNTVDSADLSANAAGSVFDSVKHAASEIQLSAAEALPATSRFVGRIIYNTSYAVSFGFTFPMMMIVRVVPKDNALVHGLVDGALAARDRVHEWRGEADGHLHDSEDHGAHAADNGSAHHALSSDRPTTRRPKAKRPATRKTTRSPSRKKS